MGDSLPINSETRISDSLYHDYFHSFLDELKKMDGHKNFILDNRFYDIEDDKHIQYKYRFKRGKRTFLISKDGRRAYEFLIEFDKENPAYGIYYGVRCRILKGMLEAEVAYLDKEWITLRGEICELLNNTFPEKDFMRRFRPTNNAFDWCYWPFWIMMDPEDDIVQVAARATMIIARTYERYFDMDAKNYVPMPSCIKDTPIVTAFTEDCFEQNLAKIKKKYGRGKSILYKELIKFLKDDGRIVRDKRYEYAWRFSGKSFNNEGIAALIYVFCSENGIMNESGCNKSIPWELFDSIFLSRNGNPLSSIRKAYSNAKERKSFAENVRLQLKDVNLIP